MVRKECMNLWLVTISVVYHPYSDEVAKHYWNQLNYSWVSLHVSFTITTKSGTNFRILKANLLRGLDRSLQQWYYFHRNWVCMLDMPFNITSYWPTLSPQRPWQKARSFSFKNIPLMPWILNRFDMAQQPKAGAVRFNEQMNFTTSSLKYDPYMGWEELFFIFGFDILLPTSVKNPTHYIM